MSSSPPGPLTVAVRRSWDASRYLLLGIGVAMLTYVGAFLLVAALLFAVAIIGLPALPEAATLLRRAASAESRRAAARLGPGHRPASYPPLGGGELPERVRRTLTDRTTWRLALWLPLQTLFGMGLGYLTMVLWPVALLVDGIALSVVGLVDRRRADEYGIEPPDRPGWALRWHPVLADLSAGWTMALLAPPPAAELTKRIAHLTESRAGAVAAHGAELRRIERDLHDGAQARIVALSMRIGLAKQLLDRDPAAARARLDEAQDGADAALAELRHVVRGIHPPVLTDRGLAGAVRALAADVAVPVMADLDGVEDGGGCPPRSRPPPISWSPRRSPTSASTAAPPPPGSASTGPRPAAGDHRRRWSRRRGRTRRQRAGGHPAAGRRAGRRHPRQQPRRGADGHRSGAAVRIVIAEDNALLREGLVLLLTSSGHEVVADAAAGPEILPALLEHRPDVAVLDVRLPPTFRDEGLRAALAARAELPDLPILVLSQYVEETYAAELLARGARGIGYLLKDRVGRVEQFLEALDRVAAGGTALDPEVVTQLLTRKSSAGPLQSLTAREREVLEHMAQGKANATIAAELTVSERAVSKHIGSIFAKLGLEPDDGAVHRRVLAVLAYLEGRDGFTP